VKNIKVFFFDLFFTLITPRYSEIKNENDVLKISIEEWEQYAENYELYEKRATGQVIRPEDIINDIISNMPVKISKEQKRELLQLRQNRMRNAINEINNEVLDTLNKLKNNGYKLCLISNTDVIDTMYWGESPLSKLFHDAVFSHEVKCLKPDKDIYITAMRRMNVNSTESCFVGDGGSSELYGAKQVGMTTVFSEYLEKKSEEKRKEILKYADFHILEFKELTKI
jgi:putative hydrolase of the HAD superfamily